MPPPPRVNSMLLFSTRTASVVQEGHEAGAMTHGLAGLMRPKRTIGATSREEVDDASCEKVFVVV